jgi:hypothetical protein
VNVTGSAAGDAEILPIAGEHIDAFALLRRQVAGENCGDWVQRKRN